METTRVLALNAFDAGSHRAFLDGYRQHSRHAFTVLDLPGRSWKWRMRHAAVTFSTRTAAHVREGRTWDVLFCTDMLNLAEFRGLCNRRLRRLPTVVYFHENQLTYPDRYQQQRDLHFAFTNFTTALAGDRIWFNSAFHRDSFLSALAEWLPCMPDFQPIDEMESIRERSEIQPPGIDRLSEPPPRRPTAGPLHILWVGRWEHDKNPEQFFRVLATLQEKRVPFRLSVLGESYRQSPDCFAAARTKFCQEISHWGYQSSRSDYRRILTTADVVVSTAHHEFFGIAVLEAIDAGCFPLVPQRLAYPEVIGNQAAFFYDGSDEHLLQRLTDLAAAKALRGELWPADWSPHRISGPFHWKARAAVMDDALCKLVQGA